MKQATHNRITQLQNAHRAGAIDTATLARALTAEHRAARLARDQAYLVALLNNHGCAYERTASGALVAA